METAEPESNKAVVGSLPIDIGMYSRVGHGVSVWLDVDVNCIVLVDEVCSVSSLSATVGWVKLGGLIPLSPTV